MTKKTKELTKSQIDKIVNGFGMNYDYLTQVIDKRIGIIRRAEKKMHDNYPAHFFNKRDNPIVATFIDINQIELDKLQDGDQESRLRKEEGLKEGKWKYDEIAKKHNTIESPDPIPEHILKSLSVNEWDRYELSIKMDDKDDVESYYPEFFVQYRHIKNIEYKNEKGELKVIGLGITGHYTQKFSDMSLQGKLILAPYLPKALIQINVLLESRAESIIKEDKWK